MSTSIQKAGHGEKRSRKQEAAILALLTEPTIGKAAEQAGINESTLWRWMQDEGFQEAYRQAKRKTFGHALSRIQQVSTTAVDTLEGIMMNKRAPAMARVLAARAVLDTAFKALEMEDIQARLDSLERMRDE